MKTKVRLIVITALLLTELLFSFEQIKQIILVTGLPKPPVQRIMMQGKHWVTRPIVDRHKNVYLVWRVISGAVYKELVTSVYFQKLNAAGRPVWDGIPKVPAQVMHSIADRAQGGDASGAAPDGKGGVYYLWTSYLLHFNANGQNLWPRGRMTRRRSHILWRRPSKVRYLKSKRERMRQVSLTADGRGNALVFWRAQDSYRVNKITYSGQVLWGKRGIPLVTSKETYEKGRGLSDGRGGVVALVAFGRYGGRSTAHLMHQKISSSGGFAIPGLGKSVTPQGGFTAQLFMVGRRPAAIYYDTRQVGYISNHLVPILMFLE